MRSHWSNIRTTAEKKTGGFGGGELFSIFSLDNERLSKHADNPSVYQYQFDVITTYDSLVLEEMTGTPNPWSASSR